MVDLFGGTIRTLENSLDYASAKNKVISSNIANVDTPNYKEKNVTFKNVLNDAMGSTLEAKRTNSRHFSFTESTDREFHITTNRNKSYNHNGNNVDIDKQMADLAKNQIYYNSLIDRINGKFSSLKTVIRGGN